MIEWMNKEKIMMMKWQLKRKKMKTNPMKQDETEI